MKDKKPHIVSYKEHFSTYLALLILTAMTVVISIFRVELQSLGVATALLIATVKAVVVGYYFMHIKYEPKIYKVMIYITVILFVVFMVLTLIDYITR